MPELPEVETTCRGIRPHVCGRRVTEVRVRDPRLRQPVPPDLAARTVGERLDAVRRRAKYLLLDFAQGSVIVHLGMSGSLRVIRADEPAGRHDHVDFVFGDEALRLRDPRRFGLVLWQAGDVLSHPLLAGLGREPLEDGFAGETLRELMQGVRAPVKQALMDARRIVGVGNIYASESLFRARIHPLEPAGKIGPRRAARLAGEIRATLVAAIAAGGSTLRDFVGSDGRPGYFQQDYFVYGREGQPCRVCGSPIRRIVLGQRSTFFCPRCQRL
ncbi:bifunctional DNA-formamidopyrimidine glycosylase/DNA-(apurinic or apyrimidinic site) lyase [Aromatoleum sp.]|uniref:bifunctional DNA-formamidopyrimidine glycosylase/DNA-(apurinic or apyrimidinic site) lyase n=1 Tax=Aromatoleum sp. TaxID=2307007 RepID=UPI002FCC9ECB